MGDVDYNEDALLQVQCAITGRATCRGCKEKICKGEYRVGMKIWSSGRTIVVWHHLLCFVENVVSFEKVNKITTARCKYTGAKFVKGDKRIVLQAGLTKSYYHALAAVGPLLSSIYDAISSQKRLSPNESNEDKD